MAAVELAREVLNDVGRTSARPGRAEARPTWLAAAAVIAVIAVTVPLVLQHNSPMHRLVRLAPRDWREVEPRVSGGFPWAPYHGPMRATTDATNLQRMKLVGAAAAIIESGDDQHAAGVAQLLIGQLEDSVNRLHAAAEKSPDDARAWSDLAASIARARATPSTH